jgi:hypothetical protein
VKKYSNKQKGLQFQYPENWIAELDEDVLSVYDPQSGVGALQFSTYSVPDMHQIDVRRELAAFLEGKPVLINVNAAADCAYSDYIDNDESYWKHWLFLIENVLVFVTYNCAKEDAAKEAEQVEAIVASSKQ